MIQHLSGSDGIAAFARSQHDWMERIRKGLLDPDAVIAAVQTVIDARNSMSRIDCDVAPFIPKGWNIEEHKKGGLLTWELQAQETSLYRSLRQQNGSRIAGNELRKEVKTQPVLNANVLDHLLVHTHLIPESWKDEYVFFWGTIYRHPDSRLFVRYLYWNDNRWNWSCTWLAHVWCERSSAALRTGESKLRCTE